MATSIAALQLIARCTGVADVQRAVTFARTHSLLLSVRDGGYGAPGYGTNDGGLVIDLSPIFHRSRDEEISSRAWADLSLGLQ